MHTFFQFIVDWLIGLEPCTSGGPISASRFEGGAGFRLPLVCFKGGSGIDASSVKTPNAYLANIPSILSAPPPAQTKTAADAYQSQIDARKKEAQKKGVQSTLLAGDTSATQPKTLLG